MIKYGINTFTWTSPFMTKDLPLLDKAKAMGFDLVEIPIEGTEDIDYAARYCIVVICIAREIVGLSLRIVSRGWRSLPSHVREGNSPVRH